MKRIFLCVFLAVKKCFPLDFSKVKSKFLREWSGAVFYMKINLTFAQLNNSK